MLARLRQQLVNHLTFLFWLRNQLPLLTIRPLSAESYNSGPNVNSIKARTEGEKIGLGTERKGLRKTKTALRTIKQGLRTVGKTGLRTGALRGGKW